ncbi:MAG: hypothetical protein ACREMB_07895, partial [Candidatus Rokuibacteriota bacterium]
LEQVEAHYEARDEARIRAREKADARRRDGEARRRADLARRGTEAKKRKSAEKAAWYVREGKAFLQKHPDARIRQVAAFIGRRFRNLQTDPESSLEPSQHRPEDDWTPVGVRQIRRYLNSAGLK